MMNTKGHSSENSSDTKNWGRWGRIAGIILLVLVAIVVLIQLLFNLWAEPKLKDELQSAAASQNLTTETGDFSLSLLQRQLSADQITIFQPDSLSSAGSSNHPLDSLTIENITISGIHFFSYLFGNEVKVNAVEINRPYVAGRKPDSFGSGGSGAGGSDSEQSGTGANGSGESSSAGSGSGSSDSGETGSSGSSSGNAGKNDSGDKSSGSQKTLHDRIKSFADAVEVSEVTINDFNAELDDDTTAEKQAAIHNLNLAFKDIRIDSTSPRRRWMPASSANGSVDSLHWQTTSGLYEFQSDSIGFASGDSLLALRNISMHPLLPKYEFSRSKGRETDRIELNIAAIDVQALDIISLFEHQSVEASTIHIQDSELEIFHSMRPPAGKPEKKPFPHLQFRRMEVPVAIDSVMISNADITYSEHKNLVPEPGRVSFENIHGVVRNLKNQAGNSPGSQKATAITAGVRSEVMGLGKMQVNFNFPANETGTHYITGQVGSMPIRSLNPALKYLAYVEVQKGQLDAINFEMELGPAESTGMVQMKYSGFTIEIIEFDEIGEEQSAGIKSFLAGLVVDEGNSPAFQEGSVSFDRAMNKGIFNYWWKSLLSGLKSSIAF